MPSDQPAARIGYVLKVYPRFSETFVVTEILAREAAGEDLEIFALRPTTDARFHPQIADVEAPVHHLARPLKLADGWAVIARAHQEIPGFAERFAAMLPWMTRLAASDVIQGVTLALEARAAGITHLHVHFATLASWVARIAGGLLGIPYTLTTHAKDIFHESVDVDLLRGVLLDAERVVTISGYNLTHLHHLVPGLGERLVLVRNGLDLPRFTYRDPGAPRTPLRVVAVGRLVEKKGFDVLIDAAARARDRGLDLDVRIAGDGELENDLRARITAAGLDGVVRLLGPRSQVEIAALLADSDVMVAPCVVGADGNADGLPTVLLEAMATGLPCISTAVTGIPEAVHDAGADGPATGILLEPGDADALADALTVVASPSYDRVAVARAARSLVEREFDTVRQSTRLAAVTGSAAPVQEKAS